MGPRMANLSNLMDPARLANSSADLNLRLMRWRQYPDLDVDALRQTKVLLLGAGTLGCSIGRLLVGWGFRNIKLLDSGKVSYSNPTRQSLYVSADAERGDYKSVAAAAALNKILPGMNVTGEVFKIPMPGHVNAADAPAARAEAAALDAHIQASDVVFLLTDSRESRWLPTVIAAREDKPLINVALGMDGFLVMRHGGRPAAPPAAGGEACAAGDADDAAAEPQRLGCYFCTDVVAATNSLSNRTLDQMCTVTRPGLAPLASALAVELCVSMLQHPQRHRAPPPPTPILDRVGPLPMAASTST
uniref:THIF-type NAD/FAD binding fold domain-containing protein n=2 Tax=Phaeomonas parva TaxID=124430 RepID=A0A7S1TYZ5_9STRA|mmetsp:Transcript_21414/g.65418  ORF Transcript_21414/g.65418 Transcript_21414/m.65418 type:complete len:303 (+) Transcript_21414:170-1078(+)